MKSPSEQEPDHDGASSDAEGQRGSRLAGRVVAGWVLFGLSLVFWSFMFGYGTWEEHHGRSGFFPGYGGTLLKHLVAPAGALPALIGVMVGVGWSRAVNLWMVILVVLIAWRSCDGSPTLGLMG